MELYYGSATRVTTHLSACHDVQEPDTVARDLSDLEAAMPDSIIAQKAGYSVLWCSSAKEFQCVKIMY